MVISSPSAWSGSRVGCYLCVMNSDQTAAGLGLVRSWTRNVITPPSSLPRRCCWHSASPLDFIAQHLKRLPLFPGAPAFLRPLCISFFAVAAIIFFSAIRELVRHHMHPSPYNPTAELVVGGIYSWTRDPIYIAFLLIVLALAVGVNSA